MKRLFTLLLIALMAILVACGGASDTNGDTASDEIGDPISNNDFPINYTITGVFESTGETNGFFFCDDGDGVYEQFYEISFLNDSQQFDLSVMEGVSGTVDLIGSDNEGANPGAANYFEFRDSDLNNYQLGSGTLTIESFPSAAGDKFTATLVGDLRDEEGNTIDLNMSFDLTVGNSAFEDCPE